MSSSQSKPILKNLAIHTVAIWCRCSALFFTSRSIFLVSSLARATKHKVSMRKTLNLIKHNKLVITCLGTTEKQNQFHCRLWEIAIPPPPNTKKIRKKKKRNHHYKQKMEYFSDIDTWNFVNLILYTQDKSLLRYKTSSFYLFCSTTLDYFIIAQLTYI